MYFFSNGLISDAAGNVSYGGALWYSCGSEGRVLPYSGGTVAYGYLYDAEGRRVAKGTITADASQPCNPATNGFTVTESYVLGQGGEQLTTVAWSAGASAWKNTNVYGEGTLLATYDAAGLHFQLADPLGTRRVQTNAIAEAELDCQSLPFGDQQSCFPDPNAPNDDADADATGSQTGIHFTGKERDTESGNDYFGARYYASSMGRMLSPDPGNIGVDRTNPQSWNMYSYSLNNPLAFTDPTGMYVCEDSTNCDSKNDKNFAKALAAAQAAVNNMAAAADRDSAQRAIDAYGAQGVDNGVNVRFDANISEPGGVTEVSGIANGNKSADNPTGQNINVTFTPDAINTDWSGGLAAHEGSHVADASAWVTSGFSASMNPTSNATELRAYQVQFNVMNGIGNNLYGPNGTFSANVQYGNARVDWKKGDSFKLPEWQILIKTENGKRDSKPAFTAGKGAAIKP